jgi:hypothetical protein
VKNWLYYYLRYDTATKNEKSNADQELGLKNEKYPEKLHYKTILESKGEQLFDLKHGLLQPIYTFLQQFK